MVFVPCKDGISHNEIETPAKVDIGAGCQILLQAMVERAERVRSDGLCPHRRAGRHRRGPSAATLPVVLPRHRPSARRRNSKLVGLRLGLATAASALILSVRYRMPIITAWSTPGAALIASTSGVPSFRAAVGALRVLAAALILLTQRSAARAADREDSRSTRGHAGRLLLRLVVAMIEQVPNQPLLVLSLDRVVPGRAAPDSDDGLADRPGRGRGAGWSLGLVKADPPLGVSSLALEMPAWDLATLIGLACRSIWSPWRRRTCRGFAVLRASGYHPPTQPRGPPHGDRAASLGHRFSGAHTSNLAAISAGSARPGRPSDPAKRWITGPFYALCWGLIALFGASLVGCSARLRRRCWTTVAAPRCWVRWRGAGERSRPDRIGWPRRARWRSPRRVLLCSVSARRSGGLIFVISRPPRAASAVCRERGHGDRCAR